MTSDAPYAAIARRLGGRLVRRWPLKGGVSADVQALELALPEGITEKVVVRQIGATDWTPLEEGVSAPTEHALLGGLFDLGWPVPRPRLLDVSGELLPGPFMVMDFVEGTTKVEPADLPQAVSRMADFLASLHGLDMASVTLPALPRRDDPVPGILEWLPQTGGYEPLLARLRSGRVRSVSKEASALLHGDFWPENILWVEGRIAAVLDWEDAAVGDPLSDLAGASMELLWHHGEEASEAFRTRYERACGGSVDAVALDLWVAHVASAVLMSVGKWGLAPDFEADVRKKTYRALERVSKSVLSA